MLPIYFFVIEGKCGIPYEIYRPCKFLVTYEEDRSLSETRVTTGSSSTVGLNLGPLGTGILQMVVSGAHAD